MTFIAFSTIKASNSSLFTIVYRISIYVLQCTCWVQAIAIECCYTLLLYTSSLDNPLPPPPPLFVGKLAYDMVCWDVELLDAWL